MGETPHSQGAAVASKCRERLAPSFTEEGGTEVAWCPSNAEPWRHCYLRTLGKIIETRAADLRLRRDDRQVLRGFRPRDGRGADGDIPHRIYNGNRGRLPQEEIISVWENDREIIAYAIVAAYYNGFDAFVSPAYCGTDDEREILQ